MRLANVVALPCFAETATYVCSSRVCFRIKRAGLTSRVIGFVLPVTAGPLLSCTTGSFCKGGVRLEAFSLLLEEFLAEKASICLSTTAFRARFTRTTTRMPKSAPRSSASLGKASTPRESWHRGGHGGVLAFPRPPLLRKFIF